MLPLKLYTMIFEGIDFNDDYLKKMNEQDFKNEVKSMGHFEDDKKVDELYKILHPQPSKEANKSGEAKIFIPATPAPDNKG